MNVLLNVLGIEPHGAMQGVSLLPLIINENSENINLISYSETVMPRIRFAEPELVSLRTENWKYIRYIEDGKIIKEELFDIVNDSGELINLSVAKKHKTKELSELLDKIINKDRIIGENKNTSFKMNKETEEKLRSLGYIR